MVSNSESVQDSLVSNWFLITINTEACKLKMFEKSYDVSNRFKRQKFNTLKLENLFKMFVRGNFFIITKSRQIISKHSSQTLFNELYLISKH